jgi:hypothetical protein
MPTEAQMSYHNHLVVMLTIIMTVENRIMNGIVGLRLFYVKKINLNYEGLVVKLLSCILSSTDLLQITAGSRDHSYRMKQPTIETRQREESSHSQSSPAKKVWVKPERKKLSEEEKEQKRQEMMANVKWREKEREKNIAIYKAEDEKEKGHNKEYNEDFLRYTVWSIL